MQRKHEKKRRKNRQIKITFTNKMITSWGGTATIISHYLNQINFRDIIEKCLPVKETSNNKTGVYSKIVSLFISILNGGTKFSHYNYFDNNSPIFKKSFNIERMPASSTSITGYFNKYNKQPINEELLYRVGHQFLPVLLKSAGVKKDVLRFDSTVITVYGDQKGAKRGYNPQKKGRKSYQPQIAFLSCGYIVNFWNRSGNTKSSNGVVDFYNQTMSFLSDVEIERVVADSGYYEEKFIRFLEEQGQEYIISAPMYAPIKRQIYHHTGWEKVDEGIEVCEFEYSHLNPNWGDGKRYIAVRQEIERRPKAGGKQLTLFNDIEYLDRYRHSLFATNNTTASPSEIWNYYKPRANDENVIDNLKNGFGLSAFKMRDFWATEAVYIVICLLFLNLITLLIKKAINFSNQNPKLRTIRAKYLTVPGQYGTDGRQDVIRLAVSSKKRREQMLEIIEKIKLIFLNFNFNEVENGSLFPSS